MLKNTAHGNKRSSIYNNGLLVCKINPLALNGYAYRCVGNGGRTKGPPKRTKEDNEKFEAVFAKLLNSEEIFL